MVRSVLSRVRASLRRPPAVTSPRALALLLGAIAVVAATAAAAIATSGGGGHPQHRLTASDAALNTRSGLQAIFHLHPAVGRPISAIAASRHLAAPVYAGDTSRIGVPKSVRIPTEPTHAPSVVIPSTSLGDLTPLQLASLALQAGCSSGQAATAAAIAAAESGGNPGAQGDVSLMTGTWDWSEGLWQIRGLRDERGTGELRDSLANADPVTNAHAMWVISGGCTSWSPWTTYTSGAYLGYLPVMRTAVAAAQGYHGRTGAWPPTGALPGPGVRVPVPSAPQPSGSHRPGSRKHRHSRRDRHGKSGHHRHARHAPSVAPTSSSVPAPQPTRSHRQHHPRPTPLPTKHPSSGLPSLPTSGLPTLPTSGRPTLPTSGLPTLPTSGLPTLP